VFVHATVVVSQCRVEQPHGAIGFPPAVPDLASEKEVPARNAIRARFWMRDRISHRLRKLGGTSLVRIDHQNPPVSRSGYGGVAQRANRCGVRRDDSRARFGRKLARTIALSL